MNTDINNTIFINYFNNLNADERYEYIKNNYHSMLINGLCEMFDIDGLANLEKCTIMTIILNNGTCLIDTREENGKIIVGGNYYGIPETGKILPPRYLATKIFNDKTYTFDDNPDKIDGVTVAYINPFLMPCTEIDRYSTMLADTDVSLNNNVKFCRIAPIGAVQNDSTKTAYENACDRMLRGELINSVHVPFNINTDTPQTLATIDISKGDYANKIQYLSMYHEQLLSRICKIFGVPYNVFSKNANITSEEIGNIDIFSSILPTNMKKCLQESLNKLGYTVNFSKQWKWIDDIDKRTAENPEITNDGRTSL